MAYNKNLQPMLLSTGQPFDSRDYIYELKFDGIRCIVYLEGLKVTLINRRGNDMTTQFSELDKMYKCVKDFGHEVKDPAYGMAGSCILDGEIVAFNKEGKPDLYEVLKRSKSGKINAANPATFVCFDILYLNGQSLTGLPLYKRKEILSENIIEGHNLALVRFIEKEGKAFFELVKEKGLEGIVAKKKDSLYYEGKRTKDWLKIKVTHEEDFLICGFTVDENGRPKELVLGLYESGRLAYKGKLNISAYKPARKQILDFAAEFTLDEPFFSGLDGVTWLIPKLTCKIEYLEKTESGGLRHHIFKGIGAAE